MLICPRIAQHCHEMQTNVLLVKKSCQTGEENWDVSFSSNIEKAEMKNKKQSTKISIYKTKSFSNSLIRKYIL
jgi:hypothetical protein